MKKKRAFTLLEIMIVIFLIGLIGSIVGYSMKGSLAEGKAFKTEQAILRIKDLLELELARGTPIDKVNKDYKKLLKIQGVVKNVDKMLQDGWGHELTVKVNADGEIEVKSADLDAHRAKKKAVRGYEETDL